MPGDPEFVILKYSAWLDASKFEDAILGAVVRYPLTPSTDYVPQSPLRHNSVDLIEGTLEDFLLARKNASSKDATAMLGSIAGASFKGNTRESLQLAGKLVRYKRLQQHSEFWNSLRADPGVLGTVPDWISIFNTWPPCLVVGVMIAEGVDLEHSGAAERDVHGMLEVPLGTVDLAADALSGVDGTNERVETGSSRHVATEFRAKSARSSIFALELRVVTTQWVQQRQLELKEGGPKVDAGRLAGAGGESDSEVEDEPLAAEDLILDDFTEQDYLQMNS